MKLKLVGHASLLATLGDVRVLSDPWWVGPCFGAQWWLYPPADVPSVESVKIDYVYVSHGHHDHFHPATLKSLPRTFRVLVSSEIALARPLRELGFEVVEVQPDKPFELAPGCTCSIWPTYADDTLMIMSDGREVCVNANDALHSAPIDVRARFVDRILAGFRHVDTFFCGYGTASHFPNCYSIPGKMARETAAARQHAFNENWADLVHRLKPSYAFPFAADVVLLESDLLAINEAVHNNERPTSVYEAKYRDKAVTVIDAAPGFEMEDMRITCDVRRRPLDAAALRREYAAQIERANNYGRVSREIVDEVYRLVSHNAQLLDTYLRDFPGDYRCLVRLRACRTGIEVCKSASGIEIAVVDADDAVAASYDLTYTTRAHYLRASLTTEFGHEILWVGSGGIFRYARRQDVKRALHRELMPLMSNYEHAALPRRSAPSTAHRVKRALRRIIKGKSADLYDLEAWTVYATGR